MIPLTTYQHRRKQLLSQIGDALMIIPAAKQSPRSRDVNHPFYQDRDFLYLTGFIEPDAVLVLDGHNQQSILFSKPFDPLYAIWEGEIIGQHRAVDDYLLDQAEPSSKFTDFIQQQCETTNTFILPLSRYLSFDQSIFGIVKSVHETRRKKAPLNYIHSDKYLVPMRFIKDEAEIKQLQIASDIAMNAHQQMMAVTTPNLFEYEVEALGEYIFAKNNAISGYESIVAGGNNACVLHYTTNQDKLQDGDLLLIDAGCEIGGYTSDITRTFPVNGKFSEPQKQLYNLVLDSMQAAFSACSPGNTIRDPHHAAREVLAKGMIELGLVTGELTEVMEKNLDFKYFMHGTSHWLGLDVHDIGNYKEADGSWTKLEAGNVITVEPGLYVRADDMDAPKQFRGIGIRIEDNLVITENGYINLTEVLPKSVEDIEKLCAKAVNL